MTAPPGWCWIAAVDEMPDDAWATATSASASGVTGYLAAWPAGRKPTAGALRGDARVVDPDGAAAVVSFVVVPRGEELLFDDPAVSGALRRVLAETPPDAVTTLVRDSSHFSGAVTVRRDGRPLHDDPFARVGHAEILEVGPGLFGRVPPAPGPVIQRYSGKPWPAAGFPIS